MADAVRTGRTSRDVEVQIEQPSGERVWVAVNIDPIRDEAGEIIGAINCFQDITPRKKADQNFRESQALLQTIIDTTPECIKVVARDGSLLQMNMAGLRLVEADDFKAVENQSIFDLIAPEHRDFWRAQHDRVCNGERLSWEFDVIGLGGTRRHMETHAAPLEMPDGSVAQLASTHDITARKNSETALRHSEQRLRELLEALPVAVYTTDAEGRITYYNQAAVKFADHLPELGADKWCVTWRLYRPDGSFLPHEECPMAVALREQRAICGEEAVAERPDGSRVPFLAYPTPLFDASGAITGAVNMLVDISDRKRAEEYAQRLAAIVAQSDDAIISKDTSGVIQSWNRGAEHLFGYKEHEVVGKPVNILIPPDRQDEEPDILRRIRSGERVDHYETIRMHKDGSLIDISLTVSPLKNARGEIVGASKIARDITERRRSEERRQLLINELNHRVKNTLVTVQSIAQQTFQEGDDSQSLKWFEGRLIALSRAHDVLTRENWEGADLQDIVAEVTGAFSAETKNRFRISGSTLRLRPKMALSLAMALHELCTNAAKYGALTNGTGAVDLGWSVTGSQVDSRLCLEWRESGGPTVTPPQQKGFGTRLLENALAREFNAKVNLAFTPGGVVYEIEAPLS